MNLRFIFKTIYIEVRFLIEYVPIMFDKAWKLSQISHLLNLQMSYFKKKWFEKSQIIYIENFNFNLKIV